MGVGRFAFPGAVEKARGNPCLIGGLIWGENPSDFGGGVSILRAQPPRLQTAALAVSGGEQSLGVIDLRRGGSFGQLWLVVRGVLRALF